jgi:hypothetical protein
MKLRRGLRVGSARALIILSGGQARFCEEALLDWWFVAGGFDFDLLFRLLLFFLFLFLFFCFCFVLFLFCFCFVFVFVFVFFWFSTTRSEREIITEKRNEND